MIELWRHHRVAGNVAAGLLLGAFLVLMLYNSSRTSQLVGEIRETQKTNTTLQRETHHNTLLIESCVRTSGACHKRGTKATAAAVGSLQQGYVFAAACAAQKPIMAEPRVKVRAQLIAQCVRGLVTDKP